MPERLPRLFTIEPGDPFLPRLANAILNGALVPGIDRSISPLALPDITILVPTRRAARALRTVFAAALGQAGALLPDIRPLGEFEDDAFELPNNDAQPMLPAVNPYQRLLALAPLVESWRNLLTQSETQNLFKNEAIVLPASRADAVWMAKELATLIDEAATEGADWKKLLKIEDTRELAEWWKLTNKFLNIVTEYWPATLAEMGAIDPSTQRSQMIENYRLGLLRGDHKKVIIAAGSTGSIPATARLLETIAHMSNGAVVLPGLDTSIHAGNLLKGLYPPTGDASAIGHPQYGLAKLLKTMKANASVIEVLGKAPEPLHARRQLISLALLPASETHLWAGQSFRPETLQNVSLIEAANEREEALAIAVALRQAIEIPNSTAALVTPDRMLARRVAAELERFNIKANDSGGTALTATSPGSFLLRLVEALYGPSSRGESDPLAILALIKHPLFCFGQTRSATRHLAEKFELYVLRGRSGRPKLGALAAEVEAARGDHGKADFTPRALKLVGPEDVVRIGEFATALDAAIAPALFEGEKLLSSIIINLIAVLEQAATNAEGSFQELYKNEAGESFAKTLRAMIEAGTEFTLYPRDAPDVLRALLSGEVVKPRPGGHARVFIWGTLEARLQTVDTIILGGLNEGTWPSVPETGPFLSRLMQQEIALEPPERRIGQSAHDFEQLLGQKNVIISRAVRSGDAPSEPARWLQRIMAVAGENEMTPVRKRGQNILNLARRIDVSAPEKPSGRPEPKPPLAKRPKHYSVTEIETLRRDPYASYAKKTLQLFPLEDLIADPDARARGTLFHAILHEAMRQNLDYQSEYAARSLTDIASEFFNAAKLPEDIAALWWPRFTALIPKLVAFNAGRQQVSIKRHSELESGKIPVGATCVTLSARADRVDVMEENNAVVMDYKTGSTPSIYDARKLNAPQLALEVALLSKGAFSELGALNVAQALFVRLGNKGEVDEESLEGGRTPRAPIELGDEAWVRLERLLHDYGTETKGYISRAYPSKGRMASDAPYDHLARVFEWSATGDEGDEGDDDDGGQET
jgi:ATP-dependent helicase/nuclease subunit B